MTILWFGLGLCICLFIFFCVLSALDNSNKTNNVAQKPPFRNPSPEVNQDEQEAVNISEPVLSFVEVVRKQPQRFECNYGDLRLHRYGGKAGGVYKPDYYIWDKRTGEWWSTKPSTLNGNVVVSMFNMTWIKRNFSHSDHSWLTKDEMGYLVKEITSIYEARKDRVEKLKALRKQRRDKQERSRLMKIYVEGV